MSNAQMFTMLATYCLVNALRVAMPSNTGSRATAVTMLIFASAFVILLFAGRS